jgi:ribosomal protein S18 acetylase RimI-like enzyme
MTKPIFYEFATPDDPSLDQFSCGYERTDHYFRSRQWFKADKGRSAPPTYAFRVAEGGPVVGYCAFDFGKQAYPDNASNTKAKYLVIYMFGVDRGFQGTQNPLAPGQTYAVSIMAALEEIARGKPNCVGMSLWVRATNEAAIGLYRKVGFEADSGNPVHLDDGDPILTMRKILT